MSQDVGCNLSNTSIEVLMQCMGIRRESIKLLLLNIDTHLLYTHPLITLCAPLRLRRGRLMSYTSNLLLLSLLDSPLHAINKRLYGCTTAKRHSTTSNRATMFHIKTQSLSNHGQTTIPQCHSKAA